MNLQTFSVSEKCSPGQTFDDAKVVFVDGNAIVSLTVSEPPVSVFVHVLSLCYFS